MKIGDYVRTPRFCTVRISEIYTSKKAAIEAGFTEPTYYRDASGVEVLGKSVDLNRMVFAAVLHA